MLKVALTGGMGCGKSVVMAEFAKLGVPCFEADREAAKLYDDPDFCHEVAGLLGDHVYDRCDGGRDGWRIDKKAVADAVFANPDKLRTLTALVHPRVMRRFDAWAQDHADCPYVICEVAVLYEYGLEARFDRVICVHLDLEERLRRLVLRDRCGRDKLMARINNQISSERKLMSADYVILNYEGNPRTRQVMLINDMLCRENSR